MSATGGARVVTEGATFSDDRAAVVVQRGLIESGVVRKKVDVEALSKEVTHLKALAVVKLSASCRPRSPCKTLI
jgi:hypothetical protein